MRIAYEYADSLITYPQVSNLSVSAEPICKRRIYPRVWVVRIRFTISRAPQLRADVTLIRADRTFAATIAPRSSPFGHAHRAPSAPQAIPLQPMQPLILGVRNRTCVGLSVVWEPEVAVVMGESPYVPGSGR